MNNDLQSLTAAMTALQNSLEKMNVNLIDAYSPVLQSISQIQGVLAPAISPYIEFATQMQAQYEAMFAPIQSYAEQLNSSMSNAFNNDSFQQQMHILQDNFTAFAAAFQEITICENYVAVPEMLIPDGFKSEEVESKSQNTLTERSSVKHLSFTNAIALLAIIIPFLCWTITCLREDISSRQEQLRHDELVAVQKEANQLHEEENQILQKQLVVAEEQVAYLFAIYQQLQESDSTPSYNDSCSQYDHSQSEPAESLNPTEVDGFEHFDIESDKSEPH